MDKSKTQKESPSRPGVDSLGPEKHEASGPTNPHRQPTPSPDTALGAAKVMQTRRGTPPLDNSTSARAASTLQRTMGNARVARMAQQAEPPKEDREHAETSPEEPSHGPSPQTTDGENEKA